MPPGRPASASRRACSMKGLLFNLLDRLAREAQCGDDAWELVAEFAAAETFADGLDPSRSRLWGSDVQQFQPFEAPAEAMLSCLLQPGESESGADYTQPANDNEAWPKASAALEAEALVEEALEEEDADLELMQTRGVETVPGFGPNAFDGYRSGQPPLFSPEASGTMANQVPGLDLEPIELADVDPADLDLDEDELELELAEAYRLLGLGGEPDA